VKPPRVPPPPTPKRKLAAPDRSAVIEVLAWRDEETPTKRTGPTLATYQSLLGRFDALSAAARLDLIEIASLMLDMTAAGQKKLLAKARELAGR
jgi:hypothetical protein